VSCATQQPGPAKAKAKRPEAPGLILPTFDEIQKELAERHLMEFILQAWPIVEPGTPFVPGRHIEAIALHLEAVTRRQIRNLVINIPPRCAKSLLVSVFWPVWSWINVPETRWLFSSYSGGLSTRDAVRSRRIIDSPWFQSRWGDRFQLTSDQNTKGRYENDRTGYRIATSVGGAATGEGGDFVIVDDPHNVSEGESEAMLTETVQWWDEVMSTRLNNPKTGCKVIIMQRVSERDLSAHVLAKGGYTHLCLPMEYEKERHCRTSLGWEDWRTQDGELLWPARVGPPELAELKVALGSYGVAGQLQQRPAPRGGGMFKRQWFDIVGAGPATGNKVRYWDRAGTKGGGDWTAGLLMSRVKGVYFVEDVVRLQGSPMDVERAIKNTAARDGTAIQIILEQDPGQAGVAEVGYLIKQLSGYKVKALPVTKAKELRAGPAAAQAEAGNIALVRGDWNEAFLQEISVFPRGLNDDQVDTFSGAFNWLTQAGKVLVA
jgi:predicted phage terminase large subunit-like protein